MTTPLASLPPSMSPALEKAAIKRMNADAKKAEAEAKEADLRTKAMELEISAADLKIATAQAELRAAEAHADQSRYDAESARVAHDLNVRQERYTLAQDHYHNHMVFGADVSQKSVAAALTQLAVWDRQDPSGKWTIDINSGGGDAIAGLHLFDQLTAHSIRGGGKHHITITVRGHAASMAGILLQTADVRRIGPESWLMIHEISAGTGGKIGEMKDDMKWFELMCDRIARVFVARSKKKITLDEFDKRWKDRNWWLDSKQAFDFGFVDEIG